jgi:hypothetical protein
MKTRKRTPLWTLLLMACLTPCILSGCAQTKSVLHKTGLSHAAKATATGTWQWSATMPGGQTRQQTLRLSQQDGTLTGALIGRDGQETPIEDGAIKDNAISFKVTRERNGRKFTAKYQGTRTGDTIKGTVERPTRDATTRTTEWTAQRVPPTK